MSSKIKDIPRLAFDDLYKLIGEKTREKLLKYILTNCGDNNRAAIDSYIENIIDNVIFHQDDVVDLSEIKNTYQNRIRTTKKNWFKQLKNDVKEQKHTPIHTEQEVLENLLESNYADEKTKEALSNMANKEDYINNRLAELENWANDIESRLTDFPYLDSKKPTQIEKAFINDFVYIICMFLKDAPKTWFSERTNDLIENPIFADGKKKMKGNIIFNPDNNTKIIYDDYELSNNRFIRSFISLDANEKVQLDKMFVLDEVDSLILDHIIQQRDEKFYKDQVIVFDLAPLVKSIYGRSGKAYELVKDRLLKISKFSLEGRTQLPNNRTKTTFVYNLFEYVKINEEEETGKKYAEIRFSKTLHEQFITNQTVKIYSNFIHRLENRLSKILIYAFQKERLDAEIEGRDMKRTYGYTFFADRVRFRAKKIDANLKLVTSSLQEFKDANLLIEDFKRVGNSFEIILMPLSESEKIDFFSNNKELQLLQ